MRTIAIVQARMGSRRLPGKVLLTIGGTPLLGLLLARLSLARELDGIVVATSQESADDCLADYVDSLGYPVYRGSEGDVLDRFFRCATNHKADVIVRITADCPLIDPALVDKVVRLREEAGASYASNCGSPAFPDGLDVEVFTYGALKLSSERAEDPYDREHVTSYIQQKSQLSLITLKSPSDYSAERWTVDEPDDYDVVSKIFAEFHPDSSFGWEDVLSLQQRKPELFAANRHLQRNEGSRLGSGQKLWRRAKRIIPGGNMLLSKRAELFLPDEWPAYFTKAQGCSVWDLDDQPLLDFVFSAGQSTLGYGHPKVTEAVKNAVDAGSMTTLNCPEEVELAEQLVAMHPWAEMARFARTGGEANAIAIRIARAAAVKEKVAVCGYHGWHDWYLSANLADSSRLAGHLLPGLEPLGVPSALAGTVFPFRYNHLEELEQIIQNHEIGVIKMEVQRNTPPLDDFLLRVRELATKHKIVLIFDECTSGFRETFGGLHLKYGVEPDMAVFGKALGNGYAITAVLGKASVMQAAQSSFISSTFWTERIGPAAALATLQVMKSEQSWTVLPELGANLKRGWTAAAATAGLSLSISGLDALPAFRIEGTTSGYLIAKTYFTQAMLDRRFLASNLVYVSMVHSGRDAALYLDAVADVFSEIASLNSNDELSHRLRGPVCHDTFERLN